MARGSAPHHTEAMSKPLAIVLGVVLLVIGAVFTFQGLGYLGGSAMTGVTLWAIVGPVIAVIGLVLIVRAARSRRD